MNIICVKISLSDFSFRFSSCEASIGPVTIPLLTNGCPDIWSTRNIGLVQFSKEMVNPVMRSIRFKNDKGVP